MNTVQKANAYLRLYYSDKDTSGRAWLDEYDDDRTEHKSDSYKIITALLAEREEFIAEIDNLVRYDCGLTTEPYTDYVSPVMEEELHGDYCKRSDIKAILNKYRSTK